jgi:hypothetical protein
LLVSAMRFWLLAFGLWPELFGPFRQNQELRAKS